VSVPVLMAIVAKAPGTGEFAYRGAVKGGLQIMRADIMANEDNE
jgi:hypothetical protein